MKAIMVNEDQGFGGNMSGMDSKRFRQKWKADKEWKVSDAEKLWDQIIDYAGSGGSIVSITGASGAEYKGFTFSFEDGDLLSTNGTQDVGLINTWSYEQYVEKWEAEHGVKMTETQKQALAKGCIGVVILELGITGNPPVTGGFWELNDAKKEADILAEDIKNNPDKYPNNARVLIYGFLFHSYNKSGFWPDKEGKMDMRNFSFEENEIEAKENQRYNFDFGIYNVKTNTIIGANHQMPKMRVHEVTLSQFIKGFGDRQVFLFGITTIPLK